MAPLTAIVVLFMSLTGVVDMSTEGELRKTVIIEAPTAEVWSAWTTVEGVKTFFAPEAVIDLRVGGEYTILFNPDNAPGARGAEGMRILRIEPPETISFEWNPPPSMPEIREERMRVTVSLEPLSGGRTRVELVHDRWREGEQWRRAYDYFVSAWDLVLERLQARFADGPIDWSNPSARGEDHERSGAGTGRTADDPGQSMAASRFDSYYAVLLWPGKSLEGVDPIAFNRIKEEHHLFNYSLMRSDRVLTPVRFQEPADGSPLAMVLYRGDLSPETVRELAGRDPLVAAGYLKFTVRKFDVPQGRLVAGPMVK